MSAGKLNHEMDKDSLREGFLAPAVSVAAAAAAAVAFMSRDVNGV